MSSSLPTNAAATPWPLEDGGPSRQGRPDGLSGPRARSARLAAVRQAPITIMAVHAPGERLLVLRNTIGPDAVSWVEDIDTESLEVRERSPDLALGPFWPGGLGVLEDGAVIVVQGRWVHRLDPDLSVAVSWESPIDEPHNSFVVLGDGSLVLKDLQHPGGAPSTLRLLDPESLQARCEPLVLPEPSVARLSASADEVFVVGVTALHRAVWDNAAGTLAIREDLRVPYLVHENQSYGWDPVIDAGAIWWMDNGDHTFEQTMSMLDNGVTSGPTRLWKAPLDGRQATSVETTGLGGGAVTNPPLIDPDRGLAVAFDSANGGLAAFDIETLEPRWRTPINTAQHLWLYADTGELIANDHDPEAGDSLVVVDIATGAVAARTRVESPAQSVVFGAPGFARDAYYVSLSTIARVVFDS